ncbi:hypothetical protein AC578_422 [Pseudocercospora eumusae]|uniref:Peptidase A1 domain-containing protein n=1 Tax=Pseudocercospora eumusae TaxID=321146 RepID=A0A139HY29_9PEZI|nr:hypothetical protein AC578_422 [Pseudocercospora eumusae]
MVWAIVLFVCVTAALKLNGYQPTAINDKFTISRMPRARTKGVTRPSELKVTSNVLSLKKRADANSLSSIYVQAMRGKGGVSRVKNGTTTLKAVEGGQVHAVDVTVGGQNFSVVVDTGSSDPWLAIKGFECYDLDNTPLPQSACEFGPTYDPSRSSTYAVVPNQNFNISYADGEYLNGAMGNETFTMAGITVPNQRFGVVNIAAWLGDGVTSGLVGFAYRSLTSAYGGTTPGSDVKTQAMLYNPLFVNMYEQQGVPSIFSMAIDRDESVGGILALGGIPDIKHSPYFVTTPILPAGVNAARELVYQFYTIDIDGFAISSNRSTQFNVYNNVNPLKTPLIGNGTDVIVDSGTSLCYVPDDVADGLAAAFVPPATYDSSNDAYFVDCNATVPVFGVGIGKKIFYVNPADLIIDLYGDGSICVMGIQPNFGGLTILGGTWMKNVLAVFDIGAEQMRFAARQWSSVSD